MSGRNILIVVVLLVLVALVVAGVLLWQQRRKRSEELRKRFGPEYERTVEERGGRRQAEKDLAERERRRESLELRDLEPGRRRQLDATWQKVQTDFVEHPRGAVARAHELVREAMAERGYPVDDVEREAEYVSVDHPELVADYREANRVATSSERGDVTTEELRQAMVHYRAMFTRLLGSGGSSGTASSPPPDKQPGASARPSSERSSGTATGPSSERSSGTAPGTRSGASTAAESTTEESGTASAEKTTEKPSGDSSGGSSDRPPKTS